MEVEIQKEAFETKGSYFITIEEKKVAEMTFSIAGTDRIIIDHTQVDDAYRGSGFGEKLVRRAVDEARSKEISIVPLCPFARSIFNKNDELRDVL